MSNHHAEAAKDREVFGFWIYLMTDLIMFAALFATYAALRNATYGGPAGKDIFVMPNVLAATMVLLASSYTSGLAMIAVRKKNVGNVLAWLGVTFALGLVFVGMTFAEFRELVAEGHGPQQSAFLSAFFALVGTHALHIASGLLWMGILMVQLKRRGLSTFMESKLERLNLFWHFLDVVWIFIFTIVYLMGYAA